MRWPWRRKPKTQVFNLDVDGEVLFRWMTRRMERERIRSEMDKVRAQPDVYMVGEQGPELLYHDPDKGIINPKTGI